ncbi:MAG: ATP-binding protein [Bacteroidota bacterium]|nr:ATP-binding protein [Bacteroidota bacterium]
MKTKIKTKLFLGFGSLFLAIALLWGFSSYYIFSISNYSRTMFKDNYRSIVSSKQMIKTLDEIRNIQTKYFFNPENYFDNNLYNQYLNSFDKNLNDEENNITETGEKDIVIQLKKSYENYINLFQKARNEKFMNKGIYFIDLMPAYNEVKSHIEGVSDINMNAIIKKNDKLKDLAKLAYLIISIIGTLSFLISFSYLFNFPRNIGNPIKELTLGIKEISEKNYDQKLIFTSTDEFMDVANAFNVMAKKLAEYERSNLSKLLFEKKRIETIINNMKDAIIGLNEKKEIIFCNIMASDILGLSASEMIGKYAPDVAIQNDLLQNIIRQLMNNTYKTKEFEPLKIFADGKESFFNKDIIDVVITRTGETEPELIGYVIILKNITKYLELDEAKTNFIATISHEHKTPISAIKLNVRLLEDTRVGNLNDEQKVIAQTIKEATNRLLKISGELLDLTQVESGNIQLNIQPENPSEIVEYACNTMKFTADQKSIILVKEIENNLPKINADIEKTAWVLINLINNAIKYSNNNSKIIISSQKQNGNVIFTVHDFGKGIEQKYLERVFEKFFRVPGSAKSGTGLGLAISKEFISKQKGEIWAESVIGEGSKFSFKLPSI